MNSDPPPKPTARADIYQKRQLAAVAARWDSKAEAWDRDLEDPGCHLNEDNAYPRFLKQLDSVIHRRQDFCRRQGIIDAGCATGLVLAEALSWFAWGVGVDISPRMISVARAKALPRASFVVGDCFNLAATCPLAGTVVSRGVLLSHYGAEQGQELLRSARSALVEGGFILWDFLNLAGRTAYRHVAENKVYFEPEDICAMATRAGFRSPAIQGESNRRVLMVYAEA